jgi:hypothetical protein
VDLRRELVVARLATVPDGEAHDEPTDHHEDHRGEGERDVVQGLDAARLLGGGLERAPGQQQQGRDRKQRAEKGRAAVADAVSFGACAGHVLLEPPRGIVRGRPGHGSAL